MQRRGAVDARLLDALDEVVVGPDCRSARIRGEDVTADGPRELKGVLSATLYRELHAGAPTPVTTDLRPRSLRSAAFEAAFAAGVPHRRSTFPGRVLAFVQDSSNDLIVALPEAAVRVPARFAPSSPRIGDVVDFALPAARPALSPGFFLVDGPDGHHGTSGGVRRVYVHIADREAAPRIWRTVLAALVGTPGYRAKVLSDRSAYPRRDALVVYLPADGDRVAWRLAAALAGEPGLGTSCSVFARLLAPGVAVADEPVDDRPGMPGLSFGQHRARVAAHAVVDSALTGTPLAELLMTGFRAANVDPAEPANNLRTTPAATASVHHDPKEHAS